jgi:hypothetical protein
MTYDTTRGMVSGNDPFILLQSTTPEVTGTNRVFTSSTGFTVQADSYGGTNAVGGTYVFLAIA